MRRVQLGVVFKIENDGQTERRRNVAYLVTGLKLLR